MARKVIGLWKTATTAFSALKPHEFLSKAEELRRGDFPSDSIPEAVSGSREYGVKVDKFDTLIDEYLFQYECALQSAIDACDEARIAQNKILLVMDREEATRLIVAEQGGRGTVFECANCREILKRTRRIRPRSGRCPACYNWRRDHAGEERPIERSVA